MQFDGVAIDPAQMLATAIVHDCSFVARGFTGDLEGLSNILQRAIAHRGLSLVDVIQPCITWGNHSIDWYKERAVPIAQDHDPTDRSSAIALALEVPESFPIGVLYETPARETFGEAYHQQMGDGPIFDLPRLDPEIIQSRLEKLQVASVSSSPDG